MATGLTSVRDLSVEKSAQISPHWFQAILRQCAGTLQRVNASAGPQLRLLEARDLPVHLDDLRLNGWTELEQVEAWPQQLRRLELRGASSLPRVPDFPESIDFVDLGGMKALGRLPERRGNPRTLRIFASGLDVPAELHGTEPDSNVAQQVEAYLTELRRVGGEVDSEVKVLLLGNGRSGKTSVARRLLRQGGFNRREDSTHGIRLWTGAMPIPSGKARVNVWDFGGQDLYHNTHQLFLESRAVYLICRTIHPDGADAVTDEEARRKTYQDTPREIEYWLEQVKDLANAPGRDTPPPRIRLLTKVDRGADGAQEGELPVSAKSGFGFRELQGRLSEALGEALGSRGRCTWPRSVLKVKEALRRMKRLGGGKKHRYITKETFAEVVRNHAGGSPYERQPGLLLEIFHRAGVLYHKEMMGDQIILDQRWALDGIYAVFHREQAVKNLGLKNGEFTAADLGAWVWNGMGYRERDQALFIDFMQSCRICFELLPRWETPDGKSVYVAIGSLPPEAQMADRAARAREGLAPGPTQNADVKSAEMENLLAALGSHWRRAALLWRWGAQIQSFAQDEGEGSKVGRSVVHLTWTALGPNTMKGRVTVQLYGEDLNFFDAVVQFCSSKGGGNIEFYVPDPNQATAVQVGISYAGDGAYVQDWRQLASGSKERWPRALAEALRQSGVTVEDYRLEQSRSALDKTHDRRAYLEHVASRDFLVIFVTVKYLDSEWCLYEAMRAWQRMRDRYDPTRVWVAVFAEAAVSEDDVRKFQSLRDQFINTWSKRSKQNDPDVTFAPWLECAKNRDDLRTIWLGLMRDWNPQRLTEHEPDPAEVNQWAQEILDCMRNPEIRRRQAREIWSGKEKQREERAAKLLIEAYQMENPRGWRDHMKHRLSDEILEKVRVYALGILANSGN
jgi:hypothetical protein